MQALSPVDSAFLWMESRHQPMHVAGLSIYTPPRNARPDFVGKLLTTWGQHLSACPPFNQRPALRLGLWCWEEDGEFELGYHLRHLVLPQPGRIRELLALVSRLHGNLLDRNRPLWEVYVIEGLPGGRFATYIKIHHALVDGVSGARMAAGSLSKSARGRKPPLWAQSWVTPAAARRSGQASGLMAQLANLVRAGREILPGIGSGVWDMLRAGPANSVLAVPFQAPATLFNVAISGSRRFACQSYSLARLKRICDATGATVNDVTLAICAGALRKYLQAQEALPKKPLIAMVPVSLRGEAEAEAAGNQVSLLLANLATHLRDPLKRLQRIVQSTNEAKERLSSMPRLQKLAHGIASISLMGPAMLTGSAGKHPLFNVIISNVPGGRETLFLDGARLDEVYPVSIPTQYLALNITISGYGDKLGFGFIACRRSVPTLQRMLDYTDESILELEQALAKPASSVKSRAKRPARVAGANSAGAR